MKYMYNIISGQKSRLVIEAIKQRLASEQLGNQVRIEADSILKTAFYIEFDTENLATNVQKILEKVRNERGWSIHGGLIGELAPTPPPPPPPPPIPPINRQILEKVIILLSNHRSPIDPARPLSLAKRQILSILVSSLSPEYPQNKLPQELETTLRELEAKGEIYAGMGNRFCIAQPTVLYEERLFCGDRAYLPLAHQLLGNAATDSTSLNFGEVTFDVLKDTLASRGISLIEIEQSL